MLAFIDQFNHDISQPKSRQTTTGDFLMDSLLLVRLVWPSVLCEGQCSRTRGRDGYVVRDLLLLLAPELDSSSLDDQSAGLSCSYGDDAHMISGGGTLNFSQLVYGGFRLAQQFQRSKWKSSCLSGGVLLIHRYAIVSSVSG